MKRVRKDGTISYRARRGIPSDATLQHWWRLNVRKEWGGKCALSAEGNCEGKLECHHIKRRRLPHLRHSPANGILLCKVHHREMAYEYGRAKVRAIIAGYPAATPEWLDDMERMLFPAYLQMVGNTRKEYYIDQLDFLKRLYRY